MDLENDNPTRAGHEEDGEDEDGKLIWLFDPAFDRLPGPLPCSPVELFELLDEAAAALRPGLDDVAVTGVVEDPVWDDQRCSFRLVDPAPGGGTSAGFIRVVMAGGHHKLTDGQEITVVGGLRVDASVGGVRLVGDRLEASRKGWPGQ